MSLGMKCSQAIDGLNRSIGQSVIWLVLLAVLISTFNALIRKFFNISSNAFLELQWYLFSGIFLLSGAYTLAKNGHVRIDLLSGRLGPKGQAWVDIVGIILFLTPMCALVVVTSWPVFMQSLQTGEVSNNAGGLILWPARLLVPVGFFLLLLQGLSELYKRVGVVTGRVSVAVVAADTGPSAEELLAEEIRRTRGLQEAA